MKRFSTYAAIALIAHVGLYYLIRWLIQQVTAWAGTGNCGKTRWGLTTEV